MRVSKNNFVVKVESQFVGTGIPGFEYIDTDFDPKGLATKIGTIYALPIVVTAEYKYDVKLKEGDVVVFSHIVCQEKNKLSDDLFFCGYYNIYAKIENNKIIPLEDTIFCDKIINKGKSLGGFITEDEVSNKYAKAVVVSNYAKKMGILPDDIIFFTKNADYEITILGQDLFKMHVRNVIGIERDGELKTYGKKLLLKDVTEKGVVGGLKRIYHANSLRTGVVLEQGQTSIEKGSSVTYFAGIDSQVEWKGEKYSFVKEEHVKFIL